MPRRAVEFTATELLITQKGLSQIPKDGYAYLTIYFDGSDFKIFEETYWNAITHKSLAKWIADNRAYDNKEIVLLSCNDVTSMQGLANALSELDKTARRKTRKIIGWGGIVHIFSNGLIKGSGACKMYAYDASPVSLQGTQIPIGKLNTEPKGSRAVLGGIKTTEALIAFLECINETTPMAELEQKGIKALFRGVTRRKTDNGLYPGNPNSIANGISTSTDPIVATLFAIESATDNPTFKGSVQCGMPKDLLNLALTAPNRRWDKELEAILNAPATQFATLAKIEISVEDARKLVKEVFGIDLPSRISIKGAPSVIELTETLPKSSLEKSFEFYLKSIKYNLK